MYKYIKTPENIFQLLVSIVVSTFLPVVAFNRYEGVLTFKIGILLIISLLSIYTTIVKVLKYLQSTKSNKE